MCGEHRKLLFDRIEDHAILGTTNVNVALNFTQIATHIFVAECARNKLEILKTSLCVCYRPKHLSHLHTD